MTVSLLWAWLGHERPGWTRWAGTAVSLTGIYLVVGQARGKARLSLIGDAMIFGAMLCWAGYTVGMRPLLSRYSPLFITGLTMAIGTAVYAPFALLWLREVDLGRLSIARMAGIVYSALFSLVAAYVIWYTAVHKLGGGHTSMYSNIVPLGRDGRRRHRAPRAVDGDEARWRRRYPLGVALTRGVGRDGDRKRRSDPSLPRLHEGLKPRRHN